MFGGGSIQLARVFGIRIGVDPSWFFILFLIIWSLSGYYGDERLFGEGTTAFVLAVVSALLSRPGGRASASPGSTCGCSAAWRRWSAIRAPRARSSESRSPAPW
jgi:hypothetical protein